MEGKKGAPPVPERSPQKRVVTLEADKPFEVEITGPIEAKTALILVHGFGVKRDARGMFTDIENAVSDHMLSVRGDFSETKAESTRAVPLSAQTSRINRITDYVRDTFHPEQVIYVGHSQGCIAIAQMPLEGKKIILLAPPMASPYERFIKTPGWQRPGSTLNVEGESVLMRSDKSVTEVGADFWEDAKKIDAEKLYAELAARNEVKIVLAGADQVLGQEEVPEGLEKSSIGNADHDFTGPARAELIQALRKSIE